jgi:predicted metalloprotease
MRWQGRRQSTNINDARGSGGGGFGGGMGGLGRGGPFIVRRAGGGGIGMIIIILIVAYFLGINPLELLSGQVSPGSYQQQGQQQQTGVNDEARAFVATVLADTEDTWKEIFAASGKDYPEPTLTLFSGSVASACGYASAATGPFYCPGDRNVYIDLDFFTELQQRFGAPGDFAQAYVLAHEVGHHVQNVLGILPEVHKRQAALGESEANALSVKTELQADCLAGVWANHTEQKGLLEEGDVGEAMNAAAAVGDDTLQKQGQGYVVPDSFTHGSAEQRQTWFQRGFERGDISACDTFGES